MALALPDRPVPETEEDAIVASPIDPRVEYAPAGSPRGCHCPSVRVILGMGFEDHLTVRTPSRWRTKILHAPGCTVRAKVIDEKPGRMVGGGGNSLSAYLANLPAAIPCPICGNPAYSRTPDGRRRCAGLRGCGHVWSPESGKPGLAVVPGAEAGKGSQRRSERRERPTLIETEED